MNEDTHDVYTVRPSLRPRLPTIRICHDNNVLLLVLKFVCDMVNNAFKSSASIHTHQERLQFDYILECTELWQESVLLQVSAALVCYTYYKGFLGTPLLQRSRHHGRSVNVRKVS